MEYYASSFHASQHHKRASVLDTDGIPAYAIPALLPPVITMAQSGRTSEAKPRLGKDEVNILEREFKKNPKPSTQTKKAFAEEMNVDLPRINNWFQNRRAKRKQEKKMKENEAAQAQENPTLSDSSSPDTLSQSKSLFSKRHNLSENFFSITAGLPKSTRSSYSPKFPENSVSTLGSFQHTALPTHNETSYSQNDYLAQEPPESCESVQFLNSDKHINHLVGNHSYECSSRNENETLQVGPQSISQTQQSSGNLDTQISSTSSPSLQTYSLNNTSLHSITPVHPSQLIRNSDLISSLSPEKSSNQQPNEDCALSAYEKGTLSTEHIEPSLHPSSESYQEDSLYGIDFNSEMLGPPPAPSNTSFKSRPPMNIALRRKKVRHRPAALTADTLRSRPVTGPCTVSHVEGFHLPLKSPVGSPLRRIVSAGGSRSVVSGRVQKIGFDMSQRSPINVGGFENAVGNFVDHNLHNFYSAPSLTGISSLSSLSSSSLAPSTPRELNSAQFNGTRHTTSNIEGNSNMVFNLNFPNCVLPMEKPGQNFTSPDNSNSHDFLPHSIKPWVGDSEILETQCLLDTTDNPQFSSFKENFTFESNFNEPLLLNSLSQPVTPAFAPQYKPSYLLDQMSPQFDNLYDNFYFPSQIDNEYPFANTNYIPGKSIMNHTKHQKTFQFSHTTPADFSEK